ncbi:hypothetical protein C4K37_0255 [Pseudomonas chlororaphis subsp. piscium]|nr:hypothetical protein C4K37_0255 [Pseudomonas chlororaphis subsp. piscium]AZC41211.1 hypothetical protein C4K36_0255 [Pseudomonas chlororaphis subsp. piscium]
MCLNGADFVAAATAPQGFLRSLEQRPRCGRSQPAAAATGFVSTVACSGGTLF